MMITSDIITSIREGGYYDNDFYAYVNTNIDLLKIKTEKNMVLLVDKRRFSHLKVGDKINISLEVIGGENG